MNKRDAINHIRQFGGRLDRFRKSVGGSGDGGRNAPKRAKSSPKPPPAKRQSPRRLLINCQNSYSNIIKMGYVLAEYAAKARVVMHKTK